jgi:hypothetical protein
MASFLDLAVFSINDGRSRLRDGLRALIPFAGLGPIRLELLDEIFFSVLPESPWVTGIRVIREAAKN